MRTTTNVTKTHDSQHGMQYTITGANDFYAIGTVYRDTLEPIYRFYLDGGEWDYDSDDYTTYRDAYNAMAGMPEHFESLREDAMVDAYLRNLEAEGF